jgi:hypothetical protein
MRNSPGKTGAFSFLLAEATRPAAPTEMEPLTTLVYE